MKKRRNPIPVRPPGCDVHAWFEHLASLPKIDAPVDASDSYDSEDLFRHQEAVTRRVYAWQEAHIDRNGLPLRTADYAQWFVWRLWADLYEPDFDDLLGDPPAVIEPSLDTLCDLGLDSYVAYAYENKILLCDHTIDDTTLLHEVAHVIVIKLGICDGHGPNWLGVYLWLLAWLPGRFDLAALKASAVASGLKWAPLTTAGKFADGGSSLIGQSGSAPVTQAGAALSSLM